MSITPAGSSNFISNEEFLTWMQEKTDGLYSKMRTAMDTSNERSHAEDDLNTIKNKLLELKTNSGNTDEVHALVKATLVKYKDIPEVATVLQPFDTTLDANDKAFKDKQDEYLVALRNPTFTDPADPSTAVVPIKPEPEKLRTEQIDNWTKGIGTTVDGLGKQDQLGLINIQEFNAQLNQAKQTASALMDSADKASNSIISHIS
jgi:hypothetical protein